MQESNAFNSATFKIKVRYKLKPKQKKQQPINGFHLIVASKPPRPAVRRKDHLTTFQLNVGNDQISSYKISPSRVPDKWSMELNLLLPS